MIGDQESEGMNHLREAQAAIALELGNPAIWLRKEVANDKTR
jgi:hypothetical protein